MNPPSPPPENNNNNKTTNFGAQKTWIFDFWGRGHYMPNGTSQGLIDYPWAFLMPGRLLLLTQDPQKILEDTAPPT